MAIMLVDEFQDYLKEAVKLNASELFLFPFEPVCFRIAGKIERHNSDPLQPRHIRHIAEAAVGEEEIAKLGHEKAEIMTSCFIKGVIDGRICIAKSLGDFTITVDIFSQNIPSPSDIAIPQPILNSAMNLSGLMIFAGAPRSGKTTSLYSVVEYISSNLACHICSVEDPIHQYVIKPVKALVQQREVGVDAPDSLSAFQVALRQHPDVILFTDITNVSELEACIKAAYSGYLILTQVNAATFTEVIENLSDYYKTDEVERFRRALSKVISCISIQKLFPKKSGEGRVAAYGYLIPDDASRKAIAEGRAFYPMEGSQHLGFNPIEKDIERLVKEGIIANP